MRSSHYKMMAIISTFAIPCFASSECEEEQSPSFSRSSSRVSLLETEAETPQSDSSPQSDILHENGDSQKIVLIPESKRQKSGDDKGRPFTHMPSFTQQTGTSCSNMILESMNLKYYLSSIFFTFAFEMTVMTAKPNNIPHNSSFGDGEWIYIQKQDFFQPAGDNQAHL